MKKLEEYLYNIKVKKEYKRMKDYERNDYLIPYIRRKREYHMIYQYNDAKRYKEKNILHTDIRSS